MISSVLCLALACSSIGDEKGEYQFKGSAARVKKAYFAQLGKLIPGLQLAPSASGLATGPWIYFDLENNKAVFGSRDNAASELPEYLQAFDIVPHRIRVSFVISKPEIAIEVKGSVDVDNGTAASVGVPELGDLVFRPRIVESGKLQFAIQLKANDRAYPITFVSKPETMTNPYIAAKQPVDLGGIVVQIGAKVLPQAK